MTVLELPAHNVYPDSGVPACTIVGDTEVLATTDTSTYIELSATTGGFGVGRTVAGGNTSTTGFDIASLPPAAIVDSVEFVALGERFGGGDLLGVSDSHGTDYYYHGSGGYYSDPIVSWPALSTDYFGQSWHETISGFPDGSIGEATVPVTRADIALRTSGLFGPSFYAYADYPFPRVDVKLRIYYLAVRITYHVPGYDPPRRIFPRDDHLGLGAGRIFPRPTTRQLSNRRGPSSTY